MCAIISVTLHITLFVAAITYIATGVLTLMHEHQAHLRVFDHLKSDYLIMSIFMKSSETF